MSSQFLTLKILEKSGHPTQPCTRWLRNTSFGQMLKSLCISSPHSKRHTQLSNFLLDHRIPGHNGNTSVSVSIKGHREEISIWFGEHVPCSCRWASFNLCGPKWNKNAEERVIQCLSGHANCRTPPFSFLEKEHPPAHKWNLDEVYTTSSLLSSFLKTLSWVYNLQVIDQGTFQSP